MAKPTAIDNPSPIRFTSSLWPRSRQSKCPNHYISANPQCLSRLPRSTLQLESTLESRTVNRQRPKLIPEKEYLFTHKRKRTFRAVFRRIVRAPGTDTLDEFYYECEVDAALSGKAWADFQKGMTTTILLRPSLITMVQDVPKNVLLREYVRPSEPNQGHPATSDESWVKECFTALRSVFKRGRRT